MNSMFEEIGKILDLIIEWLFSFQNNDVQILIWSGFVGALLVFLVEYLRKPRISIELLECCYDFKLPSNTTSKNWKIRVAYKKSFLNLLFFRYPVSNLKVNVELIGKNTRKEFTLKADGNPNVYQERDVPFAIAKINLGKGESEMYPVLNYSSGGWLPFEVWSIFLNKNRRRYVDLGKYSMIITASSDQVHTTKKFNIYIEEDLQIL